MDWESFKASLESAAPPADAPPALLALWWDRKGDWDRAHEMAQADPSTDGAAVHAYLHRKEGDIANAGYWYRRAGRATETGALEAEWERLARDVAEKSDPRGR
jgi:hypothetical protein